ncbi:MAG: SGNH/GDSL hydrolase family protein [Candidatus Nealsonbacteria bacterium]|nr:SGNH/GDSL hydrolase family protein [Candidatus Nealsonbacteria bacterium]
MKINNALANLGLLFASLIFTFIILEVLVRIFFPAPRSPNVFDPVIGYKYRPNSEVSFFVQGKEVKNKVNSIGFLDENHSFEKPGETYRVVFIGDSYVESTNVLRENTFPKIFEREMNEVFSSRVKSIRVNFEAINLGMNGFGTAHEYLTLKEYGLKFSPDLVILVFSDNDLMNNFAGFTTNIDPAFDIIEGRLQQVRFPTPLKGGGFREFVSSNFQLPRFLVQKLSKISFFRNFFTDLNLISAVKEREGEAIPFSYKMYSPEFQKDTERQWEITKALISQTKSVAEESGALFKVVLLASKENKKEKEDLLKTYPGLKSVDFYIPQKILSRYFEEQGINYVDMRPYVSETEEPLNYPVEDGGHYNLAGHRLVAKAILDYIEWKSGH